MTVNKKTEIADNNIEQKKVQYILDRQIAKISA